MDPAEGLASKQKQISISEFFEKNKHFLGFDTLQRSLITAVKEAVDNSLDACEEAGILPEIFVTLERLKGDRMRLTSEDNGPGISASDIENVFGKFLLGSRFHSIRQTRGQQGIGITGVVMYSQLTTGSKTHVVSLTKEDNFAYFADLGIDTRKNKATKSGHRRDVWEDKRTSDSHGLKIVTEMRAKYQKGKQSVFQYLRMSSIVNPHASITLQVIDRDGKKIEDVNWKRTSDRMPKSVREIKPHPLSTTLASLQRMLQNSTERNLNTFLQYNFESTTTRVRKEIISKSEIGMDRVPKRLKAEEAVRLHSSFSGIKYPKQRTEALEKCLSPIEDLLIQRGLSKAIDSSFASTTTRKPLGTDGTPVQVEAGLVFGGDIQSDGPIEILRFANRVPLMYQQGGCLITKAIESVDWKPYGLDHPAKRGIPKGPAAVLVHIASTNVQFTSEAKEAVADNEEVFKEIRRALREVGNNLKRHLKKSSQRKKAREKFDLINIILPEISKKSSELLSKEEPDLAPIITKIMNAVFCEEMLGWDEERGLATCSITIYNYTARARAFTILAKWPEGDGITISDNPLVGKRQARGLWSWRLDTLNPGTATTIYFGVSGLRKGEWSDLEIFFRGNGEIIGATKIDEKLLDELKKSEALEAAEAELEKTKGTIVQLKERSENNEESQTKPPIEGQTSLLDDVWNRGEMEVDE